MTKAELLALAARVEAAEGNSIIYEVATALNRGELFAFIAVGAYLDAAASLVPEGAWWMVQTLIDGRAQAIVGVRNEDVCAATPALALIAAALRAMAEETAA